MLRTSVGGPQGPAALGSPRRYDDGMERRRTVADRGRRDAPSSSELGELRRDPSLELGDECLDDVAGALGRAEVAVREEVPRPDSRVAADERVEPDRCNLLRLGHRLVAELLVLDARLVVA